MRWKKKQIDAACARAAALVERASAEGADVRVVLEWSTLEVRVLPASDAG